MSKSEVDFIASLAGDFTQSLALERNLGAVSTRQWVTGLYSVPLTFRRGPQLEFVTIGEGYSLGDMREVTIIPNSTPSAFWRRQDFYKREFRQACIGFVFGSDGTFGTRQFPVVKTGQPFLRLFFRVRGVCEMVGWGTEGEVLLDQTSRTESTLGNVYSLTSSVFRLTNQNYTLRFKSFSSEIPDRIANTTEGLILNRTMEPEQPAIEGTFYIDRVVAVSAVLGAADSFSASLGVGRAPAFVPDNNYVNPGDPPNGDYPGSLFANIPGGSGTIFGGNAFTLSWGNPKTTNPLALTGNLPNGRTTLIPEQGFPVADASQPGGTRLVPVSLTNALEVVFMGARAESELRPEETIDVRTPELLNEF